MFPRVIAWLIVASIVDYWLWSGVNSSLPSIPIASAFLVTSIRDIPYLGTVVFWAAILLAIVAVAYGVSRIWEWAKNVFAVTNFRVLHQIGIIGTTFEEIPLVQIRDVEVDQGIRQRILGFGWVRIYSLQMPAAGRGATHDHHAPHERPEDRARSPSEAPGLEDWWCVPNPYAIEKEIESQTETLVVGRTNLAPPVPVR